MEVEGVVAGVCLVSQEAGISSQQGLNMEIPPQGLGSQSVRFSPALLQDLHLSVTSLRLNSLSLFLDVSCMLGKL